MSIHREVFEVQKSTFLGRSKKRVAIVELSEQESESKIVFTTTDGKVRQVFQFHSILGVEQLSTGENIDRSVVFRFVSPLLESATGRGKTQRILTFASSEKRDEFVRIIGLMSPRFVARNIDGTLTTNEQANAAMATLCKYAEEAMEHRRNTTSISSLVSTDGVPRVLATSFRGTSNVGANPYFSLFQPTAGSDLSKRSLPVNLGNCNRDFFYVFQENIFGYMELKVLSIVNESKILVTAANKGEEGNVTSEYNIRDITGLYSHVGDFAVLGLDFRRSPAHTAYTSTSDDSTMTVFTFGSAAVRDRFATRIIALLTQLVPASELALQLDEFWNGPLPSNQFERFQSIQSQKKQRVTILLGVGIKTDCIYVLQVRDSAALALQNEEARALHGYNSFSSSQTPILSDTPVLYHWKRPYHMTIRTLAPTKVEITVSGDCSAKLCSHDPCTTMSPNTTMEMNPDSSNVPGCVPQGCSAQGEVHHATYQFEFASRVLTERFCAIFTAINNVSCNANLPPLSSLSPPSLTKPTSPTAVPSAMLILSTEASEDMAANPSNNEDHDMKEKKGSLSISTPLISPSQQQPQQQAQQKLPLSLSPSHYWKGTPPRRTFTFHLATYNVSGAQPPPPPTHLNESPLQSWFPSPGSDHSIPDGPDFYSVTLQEVGKFRDQWITALSLQVGPSYYLVARSMQWEMCILLFSKRKWQRHISCISTGATPTGIAVAKEVTGVQLGNKGGVGIGWAIFGQYYAVIGSHFAARASRIKRRERDYREIVAKLGLKGHTADTDLLHGFDHIFWLGDLNYRVELPFDTVVQHYREKDWDTLLKNDQLYHQLRSGKVFPGFWEPKINFPPTYRWSRDREEFSWKNAQAASYTDRILYKSRYHPFATTLKEHRQCKQKPLDSKIHAYLSRATGSPVLMSQGDIVQDLKQVPDTLHVSGNTYENVQTRVECIEYSSDLHYYGSDHRPVFCTLRIHTHDPWRTLFQPPTAVWNTIYSLTRPLFFTPDDFIRLHTPAIQITNLRVHDIEGLTGPPSFSVSFQSNTFPGHGVVSIPLLPTSSIDSNLASQYEKAYEWLQIQKRQVAYLDKKKTKQEKERVKQMIKQAQQAGLGLPPHETIQPSGHTYGTRAQLGYGSAIATASGANTSDVTDSPAPPGIQQIKRGVSTDGNSWVSDDSSDDKEDQYCECGADMEEDGFEYLCSNPGCYPPSCNSSIDHDLESRIAGSNHAPDDPLMHPKSSSPSSSSSSARSKSLSLERIRELVASTLTYTPTGRELEQDTAVSKNMIRNALPPIPLVHWHPGYLRTQGILISVRNREGTGGTSYLRSVAKSAKSSSVVPHAPSSPPAPAVASPDRRTYPHNRDIGAHPGSPDSRLHHQCTASDSASSTSHSPNTTTSTASTASTTEGEEYGGPKSPKHSSPTPFALDAGCPHTHPHTPLRKSRSPSPLVIQTYPPNTTSPGSAWHVRNLNDFTNHNMQPFSFLTRRKKKRMSAYAFLPFATLIDHCAEMYREVLQGQNTSETAEEEYKKHHTSTGLPLALAAPPLHVTLPLLLASQQVGTISFTICLRSMPDSGLGMSRQDETEQVPYEYALLALRKYLPTSSKSSTDPAQPPHLELLETASVPRPFCAGDCVQSSAGSTPNATAEDLEKEDALIEEEWLRISMAHKAQSTESSAPSSTQPSPREGTDHDIQTGAIHSDTTRGTTTPILPVDVTSPSLSQPIPATTKRRTRSRVAPAPIASPSNNSSDTDDVQTGPTTPRSAAATVITPTPGSATAMVDNDTLSPLRQSPARSHATSLVPDRKVDGTMVPQSLFAPRRGISSLSMPRNFSLSYLVGSLQRDASPDEQADRVQHLARMASRSVRLSRSGYTPSLPPLVSSTGDGVKPSEEEDTTEKKDGVMDDNTLNALTENSKSMRNVYHHAQMLTLDALEVLETMDDSDSDSDSGYEEHEAPFREDFTEPFLRPEQEPSSMSSGIISSMDLHTLTPPPVKKKSSLTPPPNRKPIPLMKPSTTKKPAELGRPSPEKKPGTFILGPKPTSRKPNNR